MVTLPYGDETLEISLPDCETVVAEPVGGDPVDVRAAGERAMERPHGLGLRERVTPEDTVAIVVTDITRATPDDVLVELLLDELTSAGVFRERVTIVVGLGLHRPMTDAELRDALGDTADIAVNHDPDATVQVGTVDGTAVEVHETVAAADRVLSAGTVEPHQYAGFSGGAKTAVIGAGGEAFIRYTHGPELPSREGVRLGRVDDNPFRAAVDRAGDAVGVDFCLNVTHGPAGILDVAAGDPRPVVRALADSARDALSVDVADGYDAVVAGVGAPKDATLYQASRAATYVALGAHDPLGPNGRLVVPARLNEGAGQGTGERRFFERLSAASDAVSLYEEMCRGHEPGVQRAFAVARVLREHDVSVTNSEAPDVVDACLMRAHESVDDAVESGSRVLVVPDALNTLLT